jgi:hypothetical protein
LMCENDTNQMQRKVSNKVCCPLWLACQLEKLVKFQHS